MMSSIRTNRSSVIATADGSLVAKQLSCAVHFYLMLFLWQWIHNDREKNQKKERGCQNFLI